MAWPPSSYENEFFQFYSDLQQSAIYYSTLAMRQLMLFHPAGAYHQNGHPQVGEPTGYQVRSTKMRMKKNGNGTQRNSIGCQCDDKELSRRTRKVSFTEPTEVTYAPATWWSYPQDPRTVEGVASYPGAYTDSYNGNYAAYYDYSYGTGDTPQEYNQYFEDTQENENFQTLSEEATQSKKKRKRRKKNKKNGNNDYNWNNAYNGEDLGLGLNDDNDDENDDDAEPNDEDYEFVSEIRLCLTSDNPAENYEDSIPAEIVKEMRDLYGDLGVEKIMKMEETIEASFVEELKNVPGFE